MLPEANLLGVDIREAFVRAAEARRPPALASRVAFVTAHANVALDGLLDAWRRQALAPPLASVSVLFPDPWFKARHHKRRVLTPSLLTALATYARPGACLVVKTDVAEVASAAATAAAAVPQHWTCILPVQPYAPRRTWPGPLPDPEAEPRRLAEQLQWTAIEHALLDTPSDRELIAPKAWVCLFRRTGGTTGGTSGAG